MGRPGAGGLAMTPEEWRTLAYLWVGLTIAVGLLARRYRRSRLRWCLVSTLSRRSERVLGAYLATLGAELVGAAPIFRNRSGGRYTKDTVAKDFRAARTKVFGNAEQRQVQDFRRSGTVEALPGKAAPSELSSKMANSIGTSNRLHKTYGPVQLASVRGADVARKRGRGLLRERKGAQSVPPAGPKVSRSDGGKT
jgi:hypothetical protein